MSRFDVILFDLDGTLTDPKAGIINSYMNALNKLGLIEDDKECIADYLGAPLHEYFTLKHDLKDGILDKAIKLYREYYSETGLYENCLYDGIPQLLEILSGKEMKLFLVTVKPAVFAKEILRHFGIDKYFLKVYGSDLSSFNKSKEELIQEVISEQDAEISSTVMIGDRSYDVTGAKFNSISSIALTYGYGSVEELSSAAPDFLINSVGELKEFLDQT